MKIQKIILITLLFISITAVSQKGNKSDAGGWPARNEIIGFWKMVSFPKLEKMNKENPWPQPYQWFAFYDDGRVFSMMTDKNANYTIQELQ